MTDGAVTGFGTQSLYVEVLDHRIARGIVRDRHYSGTIVNNSRLHLGLYRSSELVGVLQFGYALNPRSMASVVAGTAVDEYLELNRMWVSDLAPKNTESQSMRFAIALIRRLLPKVAWIQSFADERCGVGIVYQACGFEYLGYHTSTFWRLDGEWFHEIAMNRKKGGRRGARLTAGRDRATRHSFRQFRYIRFLRRSARRHLLLPVQPYPKPNPTPHAACPLDEPEPSGESRARPPDAAPSTNAP